MSRPYRTVMKSGEIVGLVEHLRRVQRPVTPGELGAVWGVSIASSDELLSKAVEDGFLYKLDSAAVKSCGRHPDTLLYNRGPQWNLLLQQYNEIIGENNK